jgi:hypothetical protein
MDESDARFVVKRWTSLEKGVHILKSKGNTPHNGQDKKAVFGCTGKEKKNFKNDISVFFFTRNIQFSVF